MTRILSRGLICLAAVAVATLVLADSALAHDRHRGYGGGYGAYGGGYGSRGISISIGGGGFRSAYGGGGYGGGYGRGYDCGYRRPVWHDTSHYDYVPPAVVPHGNHYHTIPGHYELHRTGHWHH